MKSVKYFLLTLSVFLLSLPIQAQSPVLVTASVMPPYSTLLSEYYGGDGQRISLQLLNTDPSEPILYGYLRVTIEGAGVKLQSNVYGNYPILDLMHGSPVMLNGTDLAPYFSPQNLAGNTGRQQNRLPEGFYQFCFEVLERNTNRVIGARQCAQAYLQLNEPPFLQLPEKAKAISYSNPFSILFQWTPRHLNIVNTEYKFDLVEIWDETIAPEAAFYTAQPVYSTTVYSSTLFYGPGEPQLLLGKKYAWRVTAKATTSTNEQEPFKNDGNTEIFWFKLQGECMPLQKALVVSDPKTNKTTLSWTPDVMNIGATTLDYRKKGSDKWLTVTSEKHQATLTGLAWDTDYEYKLGNRCVITDDFTYGGLQSFKTLTQDTANCVPSIQERPNNQEPIAMLRRGDTIYASGFQMRLTQVTGANGVFSGQGYLALLIPTTTTEVSVKAAFTNISINTDRQVVAGKIISLYDKSERGVGHIDPVIEGGIGVGEVVTGNTTVDATVDVPIDPTVDAVVTVIGDGSDTTYTITMTSVDDKPVTITSKKLPAIVQDSKGDIYSVDKDGKITPIGKASSELLAGKTSEVLDKLNSDKGKVTFEAHPQQVYAFDPYQADYDKSILFSLKYESLNNGQYRVANKLLVENSTDKIIAKINNLHKDLNEDSIHFITARGVELVATKKASRTYEITLLSGPSNDAQELYAIYRDNEGFKKNTSADFTSKDFTYSLGKLKIATYEEKEFTVKIVPVGDATVDAEKISANLNATYNKIGIKWTVIPMPSIGYEGWDDGDKVLDIKEAGKNNKYSEEMQKLNAYYISSTGGVEEKVPYLFVFDKAPVNGKGDVEGDMLRNRQFGYLFPSTKDKLASHELAHGMFHLEHTFEDKYRFSQNELTDNLMSYGDGTSLTKLQWDAVHAPGMVFGIFEKEGDAALIRGVWLTPDWMPFKYDLSNVICNGPKYVQGTVSGISTGQCYNANFDDFDVFQGYINSNGAELPIEELYTLDNSAKVYIYHHNGGCPNDKYYSTTWEYIKAKEGTVLDFDNSNFKLEGDVKCNGIKEESVEIRKTPCKALPSNQDQITVDYLVNNFFAHQRPSCFLEINITTRKKLIKEMLENWVVTECTQSVDLPSFPIGNCYEPLVYNLILSTPDVEGKIILDYLKSEKILDDLLSKTQFSTFDQVANRLSSWIFKYYPRPSANEAITKALDQELKVIDYIDNKVSGSIEGESITLKRDVVGPMLHTGDYIPEVSFPINAYSYVIVVFKDDVGAFKKGDRKVMPVMQAFYLFNKDRREFLISSSQLIFDIALLGLGVGEIEIAYNAYKSSRGAYAFFVASKGIADVGMSLADFTINNGLAEEWSKTEEGKKRLDRWNTISIAYMAGTLSLTALESAVAKYGQNGRTINNAQQFDDVCHELDGLVTSGGNLANSLKKLVNKASSENILWKNIDETNIIWSNPNSNILSTAKSFANETGASLYDAVLSNDNYVKFDLSDGRILLGNTNGNYHAFAVLNDADLGAFKSSVLNVSDEVFNIKLSQLLSTNAAKLQVLSGVVSKQLNIAGKTVTLSSSKVNTMLGRFRPDVANIFNELGSFKNVGLGETQGGINILNKPDYYYDASSWWSAYNKPWLEKAIARGDDIYLATIPTKADDIIKNGRLLGAYAEELNHIVIKNYKPVNITITEWTNIKTWLGH